MNGGQPRRTELLAVGRRLFASHPYDELSIDDLARAGGVAKGLLYYYFGSKRGYYIAVVTEALSELRERTAIDPSLPGPERMRRSLAANLEYIEENAAGYRMLMRSGIGADSEVHELLDTERQRALHEISEALTGAADPPSPELRVLIYGWLWFFEGAVLDWVERGGLSREEMLELLLEAFEETIARAAISGSRRS